MLQPQQDHAIRVLVAAGEMRDEGLDIAETALALALLELGDAPLAAYRSFLQSMVRDAAREVRPQMQMDEKIDLLNRIIINSYGFCGDGESYNDPANANLIQVIERRRGLPVALGILYLHVGRALGWAINGLSFPGHFLLRLESGGKRAIIDPFEKGRVRNTAELRQLLKAVEGEAAELLPSHYAPVSDRTVLLRLQNNVKIRRLQQGALEDAVQTLQTMVLFAPLEPALWRELGLFQARLGRLQHAIASLETYLSLDIPDALKHQTASFLQKLRSSLQ